MRRLSGLLCLLAFALGGCGSHQSAKLHSPDQKPAAQNKQTLAKNESEQDLKNTAFTIPVQVNDSVLSFIRIFQNSRRDELGGGLIRSGRYINAMKQIFKEEGLPEDLAYTALIESSFKSNAYSHARA